MLKKQSKILHKCRKKPKSVVKPSKNIKRSRKAVKKPIKVMKIRQKPPKMSNNGQNCRTTCENDEKQSINL